LSNYADPRYLYGYYSTYVKLPLSVPVSRLEKILADYCERNIAPLMTRADFRMSLDCEPLLDIHLFSDLNGPYGANNKIQYVYIFALIAFLILIIACFNYINLTTAKRLNRAREVGIRKVIGSMRSHINLLFLIESVIFCWLAMGVSFVLVILSWPAFNNLIGKSIHLNGFGNPMTWVGCFVFAALIGVLTGIYPALYLSGFNPIHGLKYSSWSGTKKIKLQSSLVVFQCAVSVIFIISALVIKTQLGMFQKRNLGFNKEQVLVLHGGSALGRQKEAFKNSLLKYPEIINVTGTSALPGGKFSSWSVTPEDIKSSNLSICFCDDNYAETMGIEIQSGRFFSIEYPGDERAIVINEKAAQDFGWGDDAIGRIIQLNVHGDYTVIGVVKNFHYASLHHRLGKLGMILTQGRYYGMESFLAVRFHSRGYAEVISRIEQEWSSIAPNSPFEYSFLDEDFYRLYLSEQRMQKISMLFSILAILISASGMFGLVSFSVEKRRKEIGVRKVLGASAFRVNLLLCGKFMKWVLLSNIIAWPIAYYLLNTWLENFAYRIDLSVLTFAISGLGALGVTLLTVSFRTIKAATTDPVDSLRYE
jgi:putative ABC transport system permease protein